MKEGGFLEIGQSPSAYECAKFKVNSGSSERGKLIKKMGKKEFYW